MIPRTFKRYSSSKFPPRAGNTALANYLEKKPGQPVLPPSEPARQWATQAERDGRLGASASLTPIKSHASRFAQQKGLRMADQFPSGAHGVSPTLFARAYSTDGPPPPDESSYDSSPKETAGVKRRVQEEFLLNSVTQKPISHRRPEGKVPYEELAADGRTLHPSGFVVPEPGVAPESYADIRERPKELNRGIPESVVRFSDLSEMATAETTTRSEKVPQEFEAEDGTVEHPSGFMPPSPQMSSMSSVKELYKPSVKLVPDEPSENGGV
ncbi:hypothetical protein M0805_007624 [Coniferiporia weirii]|nr:hypothetical protein M0805_007624 [Coniferiporia weirii]